MRGIVGLVVGLTLLGGLAGCGHGDKPESAIPSTGGDACVQPPPGKIDCD